MINFEELLQTTVLYVGQSLLIVVVGFSLSKAVKTAIWQTFSKFPVDENRAGRYATIAKILIDIIKYGTYLIVTISVLHIFFGTTFQSFLAMVGVGGIAIAFGAQNFIRDVISGFFLLLDGQLAVGDDVTISGCAGIVEDIGLRATRIRNYDGELIIIPNGEIKIIVNRSK